MKNLKPVVYNKLLLQAEEAKEQGLKKLAAGIMSALPPYPEEEITTYSSEELNEDIYNNLWKLAASIIKYYDLTSVDAEKISEAIELSSQTVLNTISISLGIEPGAIGPNEPKLPGQDK